MDKKNILIYVVLTTVFLVVISIFYLNIKMLRQGIIDLNIKLEYSLEYLNEYTIDEINQELECIEQNLDYLFNVGDGCEKSFPGE
jgi:CHASE3 domain sensor protein